MLQLFMFSSTRKTDKCSYITIISSNEKRARQLAKRKFLSWGYKGRPKRLAV